MQCRRGSSRNHGQISKGWSTSIPAAQRNDLSLSNKKDNLDSGNIASGTLGILVVDFVLYGILFDPLRVIVNVQRFVRESKFFFSNYCIANLHTTIGQKLCAWNTKTNRETFAKKEWPGAQPGCPYLLFLLTAIIVFVLAILLGRALCISYRNWSQLCAAYSAVYSANNG